MANYKLNIKAEHDLKNIYQEGVLKYGERQADNYYDALLARLVQIDNQPYLYPSVEHIQEGYRRSVFERESIYYRIGERVEIMRIIGQQMI